jgi:hypothetical protein
MAGVEECHEFNKLLVLVALLVAVGTLKQFLI